MLEIIRSGLTYSSLDVSKLSANVDTNYLIERASAGMQYAINEHTVIRFYIGTMEVTYNGMLSIMDYYRGAK